MRGHFSIEWMAQSSSSSGQQEPSRIDRGPEACGTHSESLPGFYRKSKSEDSVEQEVEESPMEQTTLTQPGAEIGFSTEEETSGYESEGGRSLSPSALPLPAPALLLSPSAGRRPRTAFTADQINVLEGAFKRNAYLGTQDKAELCKKLSLSDKQVRNWFQNRRMKLKRSVQDALAHACHANVASQLLQFPELQSYRPGPYTRLFPLVGGELLSCSSPSSSSSSGPASFPHCLQYSSALPGTSTSSVSLDSFYSLRGLPAVRMPSAPNHMWTPCYPPYY